MELSGIIFVALALAWAAYLIPKALRHHDDVVRSRSVDRFSHTMRVLARREPVSRRDARLVVTPTRGASSPVVETKAHPTPSEPTMPVARSKANRAATRRRQRVLAVLLLANAAVIAVAATGRVGWVWEAIPAGLVVLWLIACRLMVKQERAVRGTSYVGEAQEPIEADELEPVVEVERNDQGFDELDPANETTTVPAVVMGDPELWDPLPMTLPTYVSKPAAVRRGVRTISLDDTGVWTSGHTEGDSAIAREAEKADRADKARKQGDDERAVGS